MISLYFFVGKCFCRVLIKYFQNRNNSLYKIYNKAPKKILEKKLAFYHTHIKTLKIHTWHYMININCSWNWQIVHKLKHFFFHHTVKYDNNNIVYIQIFFSHYTIKYIQHVYYYYLWSTLYYDYYYHTSTPT